VNSITLKTHITSNNKCKLLSMVSLFFLSLNIPPMAFIFLHVHCLLINVSSLKLIRPIITRLFVPYKSTWKHFMSSLWMNVIDFISWLLHIINLLSLVVLTPPRLPYIPFANCAHLFTSCVNSFAECDISMLHTLLLCSELHFKRWMVWILLCGCIYFFEI
jgi:hypothetical protein